MRHARIATILATTMLAALSPGGAARADGIEGKVAICAACHGAKGVPVNASIPVIWGQNEGYLYLNLRDFKLGNRRNATMSALAKGMEKADMKAIAAYFAAKPWPDLQQPRADEATAKHAETIDNSAGCKGCHMSEWQGDSTTPRLADQSLPYLRETMAQFRNGERTNNPWMAALLKTYTDSDIDALAHYLAGY